MHLLQGKVMHLRICFLLLLSPFLPFTTGETLHGTTILNWPFVNQLLNGQFEGFCVDLLNELAPLMGMAYTLKAVPDGQYGGWLNANGSVNGMVGEVMRGDADFAIGDLTVLTTRDRFVDFSIPFLEYGLSALVRKDQIAGSSIRNFKDLSEQTSLAYGVKKIGANLPLFHNSPVVARMYSYMDTHPSVFVDGEREGVEKVKRERYAFIGESPFVEYVVNRDCSLAAIDDRRKHFQFEYAVAVAKGSPLKARFSRAIRTLRKSGRLGELKDKYWKSDKCIATTASDSVLVKADRSKGGADSSGTVNFAADDAEKKDKSDRIQSEDANKVKNNQQSGTVRQAGNYRFPHDEVSDEEVEFLKPRPERENRRRPVTRRDQNAVSWTTPGIWITLTCLTIALLNAH